MNSVLGFIYSFARMCFSATDCLLEKLLGLSDSNVCSARICYVAVMFLVSVSLLVFRDACLLLYSWGPGEQYGCKDLHYNSPYLIKIHIEGHSRNTYMSTCYGG